MSSSREVKASGPPCMVRTSGELVPPPVLPVTPGKDQAIRGTLAAACERVPCHLEDAISQIKQHLLSCPLAFFTPALERALDVKHPGRDDRTYSAQELLDILYLTSRPSQPSEETSKLYFLIYSNNGHELAKEDIKSLLQAIMHAQHKVHLEKFKV